MGVDIAICVVVFISAVCYAHIGFIRTFISLIQWVACIALGLFFADDIKRFIYDIGLGKGMEKSIATALANKADDSGMLSSIPGIFHDWAGNATEFAANELASNITTLVLIVLSFILIVLAVKIVLFAVVHLFSKKYNDGPLAFLDSTSGLIIGIFLGVFYVLIAMAVLVPIMQWLPESTADAVSDYLDTSYFSGIIYDNNPLLTLIHTFI